MEETYIWPDEIDFPTNIVDMGLLQTLHMF